MCDHCVLEWGSALKGSPSRARRSLPARVRARNREAAGLPIGVRDAAGERCLRGLCEKWARLQESAASVQGLGGRPISVQQR